MKGRRYNGAARRPQQPTLEKAAARSPAGRCAPRSERAAKRLFVLLVFVVALALQVASQTAAPPAPPSSQDDSAPKTTYLKLRYGFEQRTRWENWNNIIDFNDLTDDRRNQIRFRNRAWLGVTVNDNIGVFVGLANEFRKKTTPDTPIDNNEAIFESLYLDFNKLFTSHLSLRVGRQDLFRGEGFILADGTSGDGSRTGYFNALDLSCKFLKSSLEVIGIIDPRQDRFLPRINDQHIYMTEWDEQAAGLYYTDKNLSDTTIEGYYFLKKEINDHRPATDPQFRPDRTFNTLGGRITHHLAHGWTGIAELAEQWGRQHPNTGVRAWAGYATARKDFDRKLKPYILAGYWAMSGDDPRTPNRVSGWDPLFSRWPKLGGDLTLYSYIPEGGVGYASNDRFSQLESGFSPIRYVSLRGTWYHHDAFHPMPSGTTLFGSGTYRGELFQVRSDIVLNPNVKGHILYERYLPGDFHLHDSPGHFFRMEISYSFNGTLPLKKVIQ
jgi:Alginate export